MSDNQAITDIATPYKRRPGKPPKDLIIPDEIIIDLRVRQKKPEVEIARILNITRQTVNQRCQKLGLDGLNAHKENRADWLTVQSRRMVASISDDDLKKAPLRDKVMAYGILYDKERLERNLSTSNVSMFSHVVESSQESDWKPQDVGKQGDSSLHNQDGSDNIVNNP